jgi:decaprenyl-phosphate phosphoribosyltransferase
MSIQTVGATHPIAGLVATARPVQWIKNLLVFAAPAAAGVLTTPADLLASAVVFAAFCLAASGTYVWNDILDRANDRAHPTKRHRPVASGLVPVVTAQIFGSVLIIAGPLLLAVTQIWAACAILLGYVVLTISYSVWFKQIPVVDLVVVASGFVLRAAAGAVAVSVAMSGWFLLFIIFGALFVVTGKRFAEINSLAEDSGRVRGTLAAYSPGYLRDVMIINCGGAILTYCLWAFESRHNADTSLLLYELTILPVLVAMFRYLLVLDRGRGAAPEDVFVRDRVIQISGLAWIIIFTTAVYTT